MRKWVMVVIEWRSYYAKVSFCESPEILRLPVGTVVAVRNGYGTRVMDKGEWRAIPGYVLDDHLRKLRELCVDLKGWSLVVSEELSPEEWQAGWVEEMYRFSDAPVMRCELPGMVRVQLQLTNVDEAYACINELKHIPVCPACTLEQYEDTRTREIMNKAFKYFLYRHMFNKVLFD